MSVLLRPAEAGDLAAVGALHQRSRAAAYRGIVPDEALAAITAPMMGAWWAERWGYERDTHVLTVAERDGLLAGFTYVGPHDAREPGADREPDVDGEPAVGELYAIHLDPAEQGRGVGRALMIDALAILRRGGWTRAVLWVLADNAHARRFYERGGWVPDGAEREGSVGPALTRQVRYSREL